MNKREWHVCFRLIDREGEICDCNMKAGKKYFTRKEIVDYFKRGVKLDTESFQIRDMLVSRVPNE